MKRRLLYIFILIQGIVTYAQKPSLPDSGTRTQDAPVESYKEQRSGIVKGTISGYANEVLYFYKAYGDTLLLVDTLITDGGGRFSFGSLPFAGTSVYVLNNTGTDNNPTLQLSQVMGIAKNSQRTGLYMVSLKNKQWFYVLCDGKDVDVKTIYDGKERSNSIMDSLKVVQSLENKLFYEFEQQQQQINVADYFLKQMMRLYPIQDPFHIKIEDEYAKRFAMMDALVKKQNANQQSMALKVFKAYYKPVIPDWKQLDYWRDSVLALHYFDQFNPADSFYIHSNILPKKMDGYIALRTNKVDAYNRPIKSELQTGIAAQEFLKHTQLNALNFDFCLNYILKKFKKEHLDEAFLYVYDAFAKPKDGDCEQTKLSTLDIWKGRVNVLRNVQIGSVAPDIELEEGKLMLSGIESKYILLVFWATWCPHCTEAMPEVKNEINTYNKNHARSLTTIAISLDTDGEAWQAYVKAQQMYTFLNFTELKGWKSEVAKKYNVYATPTMILLDKDKKILAKPETVNELKNKLLTLN